METFQNEDSPVPAARLPLAPGETPDVAGAFAEQLRTLLAPLNDPAIQARLGEEVELAYGYDERGSWMVTQGERFRIQGGWIQGQRYLRLDTLGQAMAVANITLRRQESRSRTEVRLSNIYVAPEYRRHGWASALIAQVQATHPKLVADSVLSEAGAALIGQAPSAELAIASEPSRRRRAP
jgi:GNAT superfamily N-acetyltransferase